MKMRDHPTSLSHLNFPLANKVRKITQTLDDATQTSVNLFLPYGHVIMVERVSEWNKRQRDSSNHLKLGRTSSEAAQRSINSGPVPLRQSLVQAAWQMATCSLISIRFATGAGHLHQAGSALHDDPNSIRLIPS